MLVNINIDWDNIKNLGLDGPVCELGDKIEHRLKDWDRMNTTIKKYNEAICWLADLTCESVDVVDDEINLRIGDG